ncbi:glycosyltransferase family 2 protein [Acetivibrio cellulolyticus]|uniref:glycosyltransferase family 2 protein n=1 Tax=Acetivibrio cellulolyticus TaxID=35830 RepID=UPI0001E300F2|nr:glycosyltransferase family 2 protein [Acetivibrio cellulolyticus]
MIYECIKGVPRFECEEFGSKSTKYCLLIPIINEGERIKKELETAQKYGVNKLCDIVICDGGSKDGCTESTLLKSLGVNTLLTKRDIGKQGAQLRMGFWWALQRGYDGFITIDGNNKDSIEDVSKFIEKLDEGYDFIQGSRFIKGGQAINTPISRYIAVRFIHAPIISLTARHWFTDTTNAYRAHSRRYIEHPQVQPFREVFMTYELLAYLSVRASQLGMKVREVPVTRAYPKGEKTPTKISPFKGNSRLFQILLQNLFGRYSV